MLLVARSAARTAGRVLCVKRIFACGNLGRTLTMFGPIERLRCWRLKLEGLVELLASAVVRRTVEDRFFLFS